MTRLARLKERLRRRFGAASTPLAGASAAPAAMPAPAPIPPASAPGAAVSAPAPPAPVDADAFVRCVDDCKVDFFDFGCSHGLSMEWAVKQLGGTQGLGLDINPQKVELAVAAGRRAVVFDINAIPGRKLVRFTLMSHFLEHVADMVEVRRFIRKACQVSTEFVLIKQPYFDADGYLMRCGLKTYWSDWTGHPNTMSSLALYHILRDLKRRGEIGHYSIHARYPISSSADPAIHPLGSPVNQHDYDPARHPPKRMDIKFQFPVYRETAAWITMKGVDHRALARRVTMHETLYDEA